MISFCTPSAGSHGNPDAIGRTKIGWTEVFSKLLGCEHKGLVGFGLGIVYGQANSGLFVAMDYQLALNGNRLRLGVVEIDSTAEAAGRRLAGHGQNVMSPNRRKLIGLLVRLFQNCIDDQMESLFFDLSVHAAQPGRQAKQRQLIVKAVIALRIAGRTPFLAFNSLILIRSRKPSRTVAGYDELQAVVCQIRVGYSRRSRWGNSLHVPSWRQRVTGVRIEDPAGLGRLKFIAPKLGVATVRYRRGCSSRSINHALRWERLDRNRLHVIDDCSGLHIRIDNWALGRTPQAIASV